MSLGDLALIVAAGLVGPLFAASRRAFVPVVVGEILAGVLLGRSGLDVVHADDATVSSLAEAGFAMLMLTPGCVITPALGAAVTLAALATLALCALGTDLLARRAQPLPAPQEAGPSPPQVAP